MLTTPQSICTRALRLIGATDQGETPDPNDLSDAFDTLQEMLDGWRADKSTAYFTDRDTFLLSNGDADYTIGVGGDFDRQRPIELTEASWVKDGLEREVPVITVEEWQRIPLKTVSAEFPQAIYYDANHGLADGLGMVYVYPVPSTNNVGLLLHCLTQVELFTGLTQSVNLPLGYTRAIRYNLAVELSPEFGTADQVVYGKAAEFLGDIRRSNDRPKFIAVDNALLSISRRHNRGAFDITIGDYRSR